VTDLRALPLRDALVLQQRANGGDVEARAFFDGLFDQTAECFLCAGPCGTHITIQTLADPRHRGHAILAPLCHICATAWTALELRRRLLVMCSAVWPRAGRWQATNIPRAKKRGAA
jgi:hypothetical protein